MLNIGRPKHKINEPVKVEYAFNASTSKFIGFCKCNSIISSKDCSGNEFVCPKCHKTGSIDKLHKQSEKEAVSSKKEYLEGSLNIENMDVNYEPNTMSPDDFKVQYD